MGPNSFVSRHPLVLDRLATLRDFQTPPAQFRAAVRQLSHLLFVEASADLHTDTLTVRTPLADCPAHRLAQRIGVVPILRAGLGMADALLELVPQAPLSHLAPYPAPPTLHPPTYHN